MEGFAKFLGDHKKGCLTTALVVILIVVALIVIPTNFIRKADAGNVGLMVDYGTLTGGKPTIHIVPTNQFVWVNTFGGQAFYEYPVAQQTLVMTAHQNEGEVQGDDSVSCQDANGITIRMDVTVQWQVDASNAATLYLKKPNTQLRGDFNNDIESTVVRPIVRGAIGTACSAYQWDEMGSKKADIVAAAKAIIVPALNVDGIIVEDNGIQPGEVYYSSQQQQIIDAKTKAQQEAQQSVYLKQQAQNVADAKRIAAQGDADSIRIVNNQLSHVSAAYLQWLVDNKWDGKLPTTLVNGNSQSVLSILGAK
ncbi:MAG: SPFH domain-containing protein [Ktedonobacteraceae bacterium]|jgi:regulator of protease activity HflC (stomatin/prohibitin superfamily)